MSRLDELLQAMPEPTLEQWLERGAALMLGTANVAPEVLALIRSIGHPPEGSHPDEQEPRDVTWHAERQNWIRETGALRAERDAGAKTLAEHQYVLRVHAEERDALRARVAELTAELEMVYASRDNLLDGRDRDRARVAELTRLGCTLEQVTSGLRDRKVVEDARLEWRKAVRG